LEKSFNVKKAKTWGFFGGGGGGAMLQDKLYSKILRSGDGVKENIQNAVL